MREETNLNGVKSIAKQLVMVRLHLTEFSPVVVQHPFTSSGMVATPSDEGIRLMNITESDAVFSRWQDFMKAQIDHAKSAYQIYMMTNKPYALTFLKMAAHFLSQKDFSEILSDAWMRSENPNLDPNSWTLDQKTAEWFAHRFDEDGTVYEAQIPKQHILALFNGRGESEVIVEPKFLTDITEAQGMDEGLNFNM